MSRRRSSYNLRIYDTVFMETQVTQRLRCTYGAHAMGPVKFAVWNFAIDNRRREFFEQNARAQGRVRDNRNGNAHSGVQRVSRVTLKIDKREKNERRSKFRSTSGRTLKKHDGSVTTRESWRAYAPPPCRAAGRSRIHVCPGPTAGRVILLHGRT